jgi:hypothetical protein
MMLMQSLEQSSDSPEQQVGEKLAALVEPVNMARNRLDTLYNDRLVQTAWGYWETPPIAVADRFNPQSAFEVSLNNSDLHGSTRKVVTVKHNGNEAWFSFPNTFDG